MDEHMTQMNKDSQLTSAGEKETKTGEKVLFTVFSRIHTYWLVNLVVLLEEYSYIWLRLFLVNLYPLRCWATILTNICISIIHIFMDDDAPGSIVLLGEIVFVHQRSPHPRADPLQFFSWMGHSKFYVGTLHSIYWWHIWSTFGLWYLPKWKSVGDFLESAATEMNNIPQCKYLEKSLEGKSAIFCKNFWSMAQCCKLQLATNRFDLEILVILNFFCLWWWSSKWAQTDVKLKRAVGWNQICTIENVAYVANFKTWIQNSFKRPARIKFAQVKCSGQETFCPATYRPRTYIVPGQYVAFEVCFEGGRGCS